MGELFKLTKNGQPAKELLILLRKELHNNPEASMKEEKTKQILMHFIRQYTGTLELVDRGAWFYAVKRGQTIGKPIAFRADFDAVVCTDGCARHLCGHDGHSAALAGFALWLDQNDVKKDVYLIFQPGEETGQGAVLCAGLMEEKNIEEIYGFHNIPGYEHNAVILREHTFACASMGMEIKLHGKQAHAAYPENGNNPATVLAKMIESMNEQIQKKHRGIVLGTVIGIDAGSTSYGVSAGEAVLRLTLRAEYQDEYDEFVEELENRVEELAWQHGLTYDITHIEEFPATINDKVCVDKVSDAAKKLGLTSIYPKEPFRWSEDFGYYLQHIKGAFFGIGCGKNHAGLHTMEYEFEDSMIGTVIDIYKMLI